MNEYYLIRCITGLLELGLVVLWWSRRVPMLFVWTALATSALNLAPMLPYSDSWWSGVWTPLAMLHLLLLILSTVRLISVSESTISATERIFAWAWAGTVAVTIVLAAWNFQPTSQIQTFGLVRQYILIALTSSAALHLALIAWLKPIPGIDRLNGFLWVLWLGATALASTTVKSGLAWTLVNWSGNREWWIAVSGGALLIQISILGSILLPSIQAALQSPASSPRYTRSESTPAAFRL